jgi:hypothetical protein
LRPPYAGQSDGLVHDCLELRRLDPCTRVRVCELDVRLDVHRQAELVLVELLLLLGLGAGGALGLPALLRRSVARISRELGLHDLSSTTSMRSSLSGRAGGSACR